MGKVKSFYLAHSFQLLTTVRKWQIMIEGRYNINFVNPFYNNPHENIEKIKEIHTKTATTRYLNSLSLKECIGIMERDLTLIRKSDGVVAYFDKPTIGTCQEIIIAGYMYRIPVYIITKRYMNHPWVRAIAKKSNGDVFKNRTQFKKFIQEEFGCRT